MRKKILFKRYNSIIENISNIKNSHHINYDITLVAVTKYSSIEVINDFLELKLPTPLAESKAQSLRDRSNIIKNADWHFIGGVQKNKIKYITGVASLIQSLDSIDTLLFMDEYSKKNGIVQNVLLQFNISDEPHKNGFAINDYKMVYDKSLDLNNINVLGLMGMAKYTDDISVINKEFESLKVIYDSIKSEYRNEIFNILSMGMSSDYEIAIKQGSNMVRIGSTLFEDLI